MLFSPGHADKQRGMSQLKKKSGLYTTSRIHTAERLVPFCKFRPKVPIMFKFRPSIFITEIGVWEVVGDYFN